MENFEKKYKRILVVNDDVPKEDFVKKYEGMEVWEEDIMYCRDINEALKTVAGEQFVCDKILLDIKIQWDNIEEKYRKEVAKYVDVENIGEEYGGLVLFMYLVAKRFPVNRIAFLSAYILEKDSEEEKKKEIIEKIKGWRCRTKETDNELEELINQVSSQKDTMLKYLKKYEGKKMEPYEQIKALLEKDTKTNSNSRRDSDVIEGARNFFEKLDSTGLIMNNKINKGNEHKLLVWLRNEEEAELEKYYRFKIAALNICDALIEFYLKIELERKKSEPESEYYKKTSEKEQDWKTKIISLENRKEELWKLKNVGIYHWMGNKQQAVEMLDKYPPQYFVNLLSTIKKMLVLNVDDEQMCEISDNVVNALVLCWEGLNEQREQNLKTINELTVTNVLKLTRNWKMHNLIKKKEVDITFMYFVFVLSVYALSYKKEEDTYISDMLNKLMDWYEPVMEEKQVDAEKIFENVNKQLHKNVYEISLSKLYGEYGRNSDTKLKISTRNIYELFWMCLHFPYVENADDGQKVLKFVGEDCGTKKELLRKMEKLARVYIKMDDYQ